MKLVVVALALALLMPATSHATAQAPDYLDLEGEEVALFTNPLDGYLAEHPDALPKSNVMSSGNWRGYVAYFIVKDDQLVLDRIMMEGVEPQRADQTSGDVAVDVLDRVFPGQQEAAAVWYSGTLVIPRGKRVSYVHMGYGSTFERYTLLKVHDGRIAERKDLSLDEFRVYRKERFDAFKKTPVFARLLAEAMSGDSPMSQEDAEEFIMAFEAERFLSTP
jgi:hypothetical protein